MIFEIILFIVTLGIYIWGLATSEKKKWWLIGGGVGLVLGLLVVFVRSLPNIPYLALLMLLPGSRAYALLGLSPLSALLLLTNLVSLYGSLFGLASSKKISLILGAGVLFILHVVATFLSLGLLGYIP